MRSYKYDDSPYTNPPAGRALLQATGWQRMFGLGFAADHVNPEAPQYHFFVLLEHTFAMPGVPQVKGRSGEYVASHPAAPVVGRDRTKADALARLAINLKADGYPLLEDDQLPMVEEHELTHALEVGYAALGEQLWLPTTKFRTKDQSTRRW